MNDLTINCDGGARGNPGPSASAFVVKDTNQQIIHEQGFYIGNTTNNQAEYHAVVEALKYLAKNHPTARLTFYLDSQLVVNQINGTFKVKDPNIKIKYDTVQRIIKESNLNINKFEYIPRAQNSRADFLVNQTLDSNSSK